MPHFNPFPKRLPDDKAKALAEKRTAAEKERAGMFADYVEPITPEMIQAATKLHHDKFDAMNVMLEERARVFRAEAELHLCPEELVASLELLAALPDCPAYRADHWRQVLKRLGREPSPSGEVQYEPDAG